MLRHLLSYLAIATFFTALSAYRPVFAWGSEGHRVSGAVANDLQNQPADFFAVQVCASRSMKQLNSFAKHYNLSTQWTAQTNVGGETWYVLLEGVYATRSEAAQALSLMKSQVDTGPWIRTMGSLQAVMQ